MKKIFILHGWTYSIEKWNPFVKLLKQKGIEVNILKIPGLTDKLDKVWELNDYVEWLKQKIDNQEVNNLTMKQFNNKVILIGHSNGGRIAVAFTNRYPEKVENLILIDSAGIYHNELPLRIKRVVFKTIAKIGAQAFGKARLADRRGGIKKVLRDLLYKIARESDYKNSDENVKQTMVNLISTDLEPILPKIKIPTLIIWGSQDRITPVSDGMLMNSLIKNSKLEIIENARHSPQFTHPEQVAETIINSLTI